MRGKSSAKRRELWRNPHRPFFANVYLHDQDYMFMKKQVPYTRYFNDIICFSPAREEMEKHKADMQAWLYAYDLCINSKKEYLYVPGEAWEFLGIYYLHGKVDLSQGTVDKMKGRIGRKRSLVQEYYEYKKRINR